MKNMQGALLAFLNCLFRAFSGIRNTTNPIKFNNPIFGTAVAKQTAIALTINPCLHSIIKTCSPGRSECGINVVLDAPYLDMVVTWPVPGTHDLPWRILMSAGASSQPGCGKTRQSVPNPKSVFIFVRHLFRKIVTFTISLTYYFAFFNHCSKNCFSGKGLLK
jgi:hypothetical protein